MSAVTGGAVLRAALRVFGGVGARPSEHPEEAATRGEGEEPGTGGPGRRLPAPMIAVPALLLLGCLAGAPSRAWPGRRRRPPPPSPTGPATSPTPC
ncbi:hypothetical protein [Kitasatospora sp. NPDC008115]|uniref:hypothetical protein n=1 Tax=Kitasatospora sp. NPDC008115 TaxID=3364022 RepID=UPI0036E00DB9